MTLLEQIARLEETNRALRRGAHDWKKRAKAAEERRRELLVEKVRRQDEHKAELASAAKLLTETEKELASTQAKLSIAQQDYEDAHWERAELEQEILQLKAEVYDLTHGLEEAIRK